MTLLQKNGSLILNRALELQSNSLSLDIKKKILRGDVILFKTDMTRQILVNPIHAWK